MATKTISILEEAYKALLKEKGEKESFSAVIMKLVERKGKISDSLGKWDITDKEVASFRAELRKAWKKAGKRYK